MASQRRLLSPLSTSDVAAMLADAAKRNLTVLPRGSGLGWHDPEADLVLDMSQMNKVIEHEAGDLVARFQAGATMGEVAGVLARAGQRLSLDVPPDVTVGGMIATALAGPLRLRYGSPRDLLLGVTVVRPDGVVAKSGGKVVKNVAGYDLGKLFTGSHGTLGVITEATFRLHPLPKAVAYVTGVCADTGLTAAIKVNAIVGAAAGCRWQPSAIEVGPGLSVSILLEGTPDGVAERAEAITRIPRLGGLEQITVSPDPPSWWGQLPILETGGPATPVVRVTFWRGKLLDLLNLIGKSGVGCAVGGSAGAGLLYLTGTRDEEFLGRLRALLADRGTVTVLTDPPAFAHPLMRAVRDQFDPDRRMRGAG